MTKIKKPSNLAQRVISGTIGASALIAGLIYGGSPFVYLFSGVITLMMVFEFSGMTLRMKDRPEKRSVLLALTAFIWIVFYVYQEPRLVWAYLITSLVVWMTYMLWAARRHRDSRLSTHTMELCLGGFGLVFLNAFMVFFPLIRQRVQGVDWILLFLLVVWAGDTGAYFAGKRFGKKKLYPQVSPKKTIAGSWGGLILSAGVAVGFGHFYLAWVPIQVLVMISVFVNLTAQIGDLVESLLKRGFHTKDSGSILPGHGGILDRFDGVVFSLPVMYACMKVLLN